MNSEILSTLICDVTIKRDLMVFFSAKLIQVLPCYVITLVPHESKVSVDENLSNTLDKAKETTDERLQRITVKVMTFACKYG